ncbi:MAG: TIGR03915 family putative DNA repair protein [Clostridia bacterium]|nr:TIGR03915 family putative DNA repair protein [Clostridia bacterium]
MSTVYVTDGSSVSFYTAVFDAYTDREAVITSDGNVQTEMGSRVVAIIPDEEKAERVCKKISSIDPHAESEIDRILRSDKKNKEQTAFDYIRLLAREGRPVRPMQSQPEIVAVEECLHAVSREVDKMKGFIRFMETKEGFYYAPYSPDADITDLLMPHFIARFNAEKFVIHDIGRGYAALYDGNTWVSGSLGEVSITLSDDEDAFEKLWCRYYDSVNIEAREHIKQMKGFMPVRYWKFLPEKSRKP